jgi:SAM-dependent methyltransferase
MRHWSFVLCIIATTALYFGSVYTIETYIKNGSRRWFNEELVDVSQWSELEIDEKLYKMSKWGEYTKSEFNLFVDFQTSALASKNKSEEYVFLEVGVGVGAFSRRILQLFPKARGYGIDLEPRAIAVASQIFSNESQRMQLSVANMLDKLAFEDNHFDYVFVPGSLCYLHSIPEVKIAVAEFTRVLKTHGQMCISMIPKASSQSRIGSCNVRVPKSFFIHECPGLSLVSMQEMDEWRIGRKMGRYHVCLVKK